MFKNRRTLLIVLLCLAVATALSAGTLAVYTTKIEITANTNVQAKRFVVKAQSTNESTFNINLAPSESADYKFTAVNFEDEKNPSEVPIDLTIGLTFNDNTFTTMQSATFALIDADSGKTLMTWNKDNAASGVNYTNDSFEANKAATKNYIVRVTWVDDKSDASNTEQTAHQGQKTSSAFTVHVVGTQSTK